MSPVLFFPSLTPGPLFSSQFPRPHGQKARGCSSQGFHPRSSAGLGCSLSCFPCMASEKTLRELRTLLGGTCHGDKWPQLCIPAAQDTLLRALSPTPTLLCPFVASTQSCLLGTSSRWDMVSWGWWERRPRPPGSSFRFLAFSCQGRLHTGGGGRRCPG